MSKFLEFFKRFNFNYFFNTPADSKVVYALIVMYLALLLAAIYARVHFNRKAQEAKPYRSFGKKVFWVNFLIAIVGLFLSFSRFEAVNLLSWRIWQITLVVVTLAANFWLFRFEGKKLEEELLKFSDKQRKEKWLPKSKKKKK